MKKAGITFILGCIGLCSILAFTTLSQERLLLKKITERLLDYNRNQAPEKTYLHTDKDLYTNGETIWFKTYLVDGISHGRTAKSNVVYVELVNNQDSIVAQRKLFVNELGASGDIEIDETIPQGDYTLRSYTKYMLNEEEPVIFEKNIPIFVQEVRSNMTADQVPLTRSLRGFERNATNADAIFGKPNVKFFPEGGNLVQGLPATMGLEVLDAKGNGIALKGAIKDEQGNVIEPFESLEFGLGSVGFTPLPDTEYYASVVFNGEEERFPLPKALPEGYVLSYKNRDDHVLVQVASNEPDGLAGTILVGHLRGDLIFKRIGQSEDNDSYATKIYTDQLQDGVAQFTLFAPDGEPVSERLIFIDDPDNDALLTISSPVKEFGKREKVDLNLALTDEKGKPLKGDFSMGVVSKTGSNVSTTNIKSWLLLDSDLGGTVQNPDYFFTDDSKERKFLLDALMLTHGWRRFVWKDMLSKNVSKAPTFNPEKGIMINGRTTAFGQPFKTRQTVATLNIYGPDILNAKKETTPQGAFSFGPFYFQDSLEATVEAYDSLPKWEYKRKNFSIILEDQRPELPSTLKKTERTDRRTIELAQEYLKEAYVKKVTDFKYDPTKVTRLDEVVVSERKKSRRQIINEEYNAQLTSSIFSRRVYKDSIPGSETFSAMDLLARMPGVIVTGIYPNQGVSLPGGPKSVNSGSNPLVLVDGIATDLSFLQPLRATEVAFIDVVWGSDTALWGARGASGVIAVYTHRGSKFDAAPEEYPGITKFKIPGFYKAREFYTPDYVKEDPEKPDYRTTLFWEPEVALNDEGESSVAFYTGDQTGSYWVKVEGITSDGRPVTGLYDIEVLESN